MRLLASPHFGLAPLMARHVFEIDPFHAGWRAGSASESRRHHVAPFSILRRTSTALRPRPLCRPQAMPRRMSNAIVLPLIRGA
jgi:hypothetical protein